MKKICSSSTHRQDTDRLILSRKIKNFFEVSFLKIEQYLDCENMMQKRQKKN